MKRTSIPMGSVVFEPKKHHYYVEGVRFPSVNEVLRNLRVSPDLSHLDRFYSLRGTAFHTAIKLNLENDLDEDSLDKVHVLPRYEQWVKWKEEQRIKKVIICEQPLASIFGYAGTPDLLFLNEEDEIKLCDWKSGGRANHYQLQMGGYGGLVLESGLLSSAKLHMEIVYFNGSKNKPKTEVVPFECIEIFRAAAMLNSWLQRSQ